MKSDEEYYGVGSVVLVLFDRKIVGLMGIQPLFNILSPSIYLFGKISSLIIFLKFNMCYGSKLCRAHAPLPHQDILHILYPN